MDIKPTFTPAGGAVIPSIEITHADSQPSANDPFNAHQGTSEQSTQPSTQDAMKPGSNGVDRMTAQAAKKESLLAGMPSDTDGINAIIDSDWAIDHMTNALPTAHTVPTPTSASLHPTHKIKSASSTDIRGSSLGLGRLEIKPHPLARASSFSAGMAKKKSAPANGRGIRIPFDQRKKQMKILKIRKAARRVREKHWQKFLNPSTEKQDILDTADQSPIPNPGHSAFQAPLPTQDNAEDDRSDQDSLEEVFIPMASGDQFVSGLTTEGGGDVGASSGGAGGSIVAEAMMVSTELAGGNAEISADTQVISEPAGYQEGGEMNGSGNVVGEAMVPASGVPVSYGATIEYEPPLAIGSSNGGTTLQPSDPTSNSIPNIPSYPVQMPGTGETNSAPGNHHPGAGQTTGGRGRGGRRRNRHGGSGGGPVQTATNIAKLSNLIIRQRMSSVSPDNVFIGVLIHRCTQAPRHKTIVLAKDEAQMQLLRDMIPRPAEVRFPGFDTLYSLGIQFGTNVDSNVVKKHKGLNAFFKSRSDSTGTGLMWPQPLIMLKADFNCSVSENVLQSVKNDLYILDANPSAHAPYISNLLLSNNFTGRITIYTLSDSEWVDYHPDYKDERYRVVPQRKMFVESLFWPFGDEGGEGQE